MFFRRKDKKSKDWRNSPAHLLLLSKFIKSDSPKRYSDLDYWDSAIGEKPVKFINQLIQEGVLEPAGVFEKMDYKFKATELKSMLKEKGLKSSGRKEELIRALIDDDPKAMSEATKDINLYRCNAEGKQLAEDYLLAEKGKKAAIENEVLDLLTRKEFPKAVQAVAKFEASQIFPRGMGIDWNNYDGKSDMLYLKMIYSKTPAILQGIEDNSLEQIRLAASMMQLWGTNNPKHWIPDDFETGINLDKYSACHMFMFHARFLGHMENFKESYKMGLDVRIEISGTDDSCPECKKLGGKIFRIEEVPELPYAKCTNEIGCRCSVVGKFLD